MPAAERTHPVAEQAGAGAVMVLAAQRFASPLPPDAEPEPGQQAWEDLPFVTALLPRLHQAYRKLAYDVEIVENPVRRTVLEKWDDAVTKGFRIVHVISHGATSLADAVRSRSAEDSEQLCFVPSCGQTGNGTDVVQWVRTAHRRAEPMLFVVDLCRAGRAARIAQLAQVPDDELNAWVVAATSPAEPAYDGTFSEIVGEVLEQIAANGLDTDPSIEFVRWDRLVFVIQQRLTAAGSTQRIHATKIDPSQPPPELPFFRNPNWVSDERRARVQAITPPVRPFVADLGADHFIDRVGDHFVGRRQQLGDLAPWLDDVTVGGLKVVTGAPGAGKSALLGALACAGHPEIVAAVPDVRACLAAQCPEGTPSANDGLAAIHARGRDLDAVLVSLAAQWRLDPGEGALSARALVAAVLDLETVPALVFDALDEADDPVHLLRELLLPLVRAVRADGAPACRLLVGTRRRPDFEPLLKQAGAAGAVVDLDDVPEAELRADLEQHLLRVLADHTAYREPARRHVRAVLARTVARTLAEDPRRRREWGPFLVARIFSRSLVALQPATDAVSAAVLGASAPRTLPDVLELDLSLHPEKDALRAALAAVAWAKGQGFPTEAVAAIAPAFHRSVTEDNVRELLAAGRFYLRTSVEADGSVLYRLFHQGLADYLKATPWGKESGHEDPGSPRDRELPS
ncbi:MULTISPECIES: AAA family ATPase [Amycolatopsis]|uniref:ATP-binding protein n=1 Tax=Amycolatopsis dendrobii TaxID=2760662 RepID=A0A7W3VRB1_9PSEU|nr:MULTISPECIES: ATP-binding protein [Amycolatopsis]MBB1151733.1 ATP-binding protein [Amycolatopsis dendrobii]UKD58054.1 ATP-binding protein [Amycolatopsis sp. FU40]